MADTSQKRQNFIRRYKDGVEAFLASCDALANLKTEWDADAYATGAQPPENNIVDADFEAVAPWIGALQLNQAVGAVESVREAVGSQRGYLEAIRS